MWRAVRVRLTAPPGGLAYFPKASKTALLGYDTPDLDGHVRSVVEHEKCIAVRTALFRSRSKDARQHPVTLDANEANRGEVPLYKLRRWVDDCKAASAGECSILVWIEGRPKKC